MSKLLKMNCSKSGYDGFCASVATWMQ